MTADDELAELRHWYARAVRAQERAADDLAERRRAFEVSQAQRERGPGRPEDRPPRFVFSGDAAGAYLAGPPGQVRDKARRGVVRDRDRALRLVSGRGGLPVMAEMIADLMPNLRRGRRALDPAAWIQTIAWHHLVSAGLTGHEAARVVIRWDDELDAPGADPEAAALLRRRGDLNRAERQQLHERESAIVTASRKRVRLLTQSANKTP